MPMPLFNGPLGRTHGSLEIAIEVIRKLGTRQKSQTVPRHRQVSGLRPWVTVDRQGVCSSCGMWVLRPVFELDPFRLSRLRAKHTNQLLQAVMNQLGLAYLGALLCRNA